MSDVDSDQQAFGGSIEQLPEICEAMQSHHKLTSDQRGEIVALAREVVDELQPREHSDADS